LPGVTSRGAIQQAMPACSRWAQSSQATAASSDAWLMKAILSIPSHPAGVPGATAALQTSRFMTTSAIVPILPNFQYRKGHRGAKPATGSARRRPWAPAAKARLRDRQPN
jgi:hypothetical protein